MRKRNLSLPTEQQPLTKRRLDLIQAQADLYFSDPKYRWLLGCAGEQGGKTSIGIRWLKKEITQMHWNKPYNWMVLAPKYKILNQATIPTFEKIFTPMWGRFNKMEMSFQLLKSQRPWGKIFFRSSTDPDSGIGIPDCKGVFIDEAGKCSRSFFYMAVGRVARLGGRIFMATTPYALNWVKREVIDSFEKDSGLIHDTILYRRWASFQNPSYPKEEAERLKLILPQRVYNMRVLGLHEKAEGLIHESWGKDNYCDVPRGTPTYIAGLDWGFDHPMAIIMLGIYGEEAVIQSITKIRHLGPDQQKQLILAKHALFKPKMWSAGHDQPGMISELSEKIPIQKYFESIPELRLVNTGDQKVSEWIQTRKLKAIRSIENLADFEDEIETYRWDRDDDDEPHDTPVDTNNDVMSALRYAVIGALSMGLMRDKPIKYLDIRDATRKDIFKPVKKNRDWTDF